MQTFLPYPDFKQSAQCLDWRRLGKQRVEARQILNALEGKSYGWRNHPATKMWVGFENALGEYLNTVISEWISRGYRNNMATYLVTYPIIFPLWLGDLDFHASHRSNLLRKMPDWYGKFDWTEPNNLPYVWPI